MKWKLIWTKLVLNVSPTSCGPPSALFVTTKMIQQRNKRMAWMVRLGDSLLFRNFNRSLNVNRRASMLCSNGNVKYMAISQRNQQASVIKGGRFCKSKIIKINTKPYISFKFHKMTHLSSGIILCSNYYPACVSLTIQKIR